MVIVATQLLVLLQLSSVEVFLFFLCLWGLCPGVLGSSFSPKTRKKHWIVILNQSVIADVSNCLCTSEMLWTGDEKKITLSHTLSYFFSND